jgi:hypothetical protein
MLVVIFLILLLASVTVSLTPRFAGGQNVAKGASLVQGWLLIAKQRAQRDQVPTGLRLARLGSDMNSRSYYLVRELQLIQQPDFFSGGTITVNGTTVTGNGVDFTGGFPSTGGGVLYAVQQDDYLEIKGGGLVHRIVGVAPTTLTLASAPPNPINQATGDYRILRKPRLLTGETPMVLPQDIMIDLRPDNPIVPDPGTTPGGNLNIMFSPTGGVIGQGTGASRVVLYVRDVSRDSPLDGDPTLVTIYSRTGFIGAHPVNATDPANAYLFTRDGRSSGL